MNSSSIACTNTLNTYLGHKGYTLLKSEISAKEQTEIKEELMIRPYIPGSPVQMQTTFPAFRESPNKLYVPRYFGEHRFGVPKQNKIGEGENIDLVFGGALREYQKPTVQKYMDCVSGGGGGLLELYCGFGKTDCAIYILCALRKKTLIIVHKEFLMTQWMERLANYVPAAKIGKIQGQTIDIKGKDIVIAMLQSLSMKDYPPDTFSSFGFTIIDEVHHISSEVFSCALFKLVTKYMLGLSATMNRKDGTTKVFKMFLGNVADKQERAKTEEVDVRSIIYQSNDAEFDTVEMDFRGNTAIAKMISKICTYNHRSEFILKVLKDMIQENPKQQIMMISQYKNILSYMYDAIRHKDIATVGFYVGGMKQTALKETEQKQVVLATYTMAAEGLDIKSLSTLFMITPMTNIEQAVGRILRQKHDFPATVVDIVDSHSNFQNQWTKRKRFYKGQNYSIRQTDSNVYVPDASKWRVLYNASMPNKQVDDDECQEADTNGETVKPKCLLKIKKK